MTTQRNRWRELDELLEKLCEDTLAPEQAGRLESLVDGNREAQRRYLSYLYLDGALRWEKAVGATGGAGEHVGEKNAHAKDAPSGKSPVLGFLSDSFQHGLPGLSGPTQVSLIVAGIVIGSLLTLLFFWTVPRYRNPLPQERPLAAPLRGVARLTGQVDCKWTATLPRDGYLTAGHRLELVEGLAEITFHDGARVILQGPVVFHPESRSAGLLSRGRLTADVPRRAIGFTVRTSSAKIVDLGTQFGVSSDGLGSTEVHVFRGAVELENLLAANSPDDLKRHRIDAGQAVRVDRKGGQPSAIKLDSDGFVRDLSAARIAAGREAWSGAVTSTFDHDTEGWMARVDGSKPVHLPTAGHPGGCIQVIDLLKNASFDFIAPAKFLGDHHRAYEKYLSFEVLVRNLAEGKPKFAKPNRDELQITGTEKTIGLILSSRPKHQQWMHYSVPLSVAGGWYRADLSDHPPANRQDILDVLSNITELRIGGEFILGKDLTLLDNVMLGAEK